MRVLLLRLDGTLRKLEWTVSCLALMAGLAISFYTVLARGLMVPTAEWVLELPMELLVIAAIYGSGALGAERKHLRVGFVVDRLPPGLRRGVDLLVTALLALFCLFLAERGLAATRQTHQLGLRIPELFNLPAAIPMALATLGIFFWGLHHLALLPGRGAGSGVPPAGEPAGE